MIDNSEVPTKKRRPKKKKIKSSVEGDEKKKTKKREKELVIVRGIICSLMHIILWSLAHHFVVNRYSLLFSHFLHIPLEFLYIVLLRNLYKRIFMLFEVVFYFIFLYRVHNLNCVCIIFCQRSIICC